MEEEGLWEQFIRCFFTDGTVIGETKWVHEFLFIALIITEEETSLQLMQFLDSNDQPRPVTVRTNSLKIRRGELAKMLINRFAIIFKFKTIANHAKL